METIKTKIKTEDKELAFEFKTKTSFLEDIEIKNLAVEILGGWEKSAEIDAAVTSSYQKHIEYNKNKFGENTFTEKQKKLFELEDAEKEDTDEYKALSKELNENRHYLAYLSLLRERAKAMNFAYLKISCVKKPEGYKFLEDEVEMMALWLKIAEERFLKKKKKIKELQNIQSL